MFPPSQVDLNVSSEQQLLRFLSHPNTVTISPQDFTVFTTDSPLSTWLPSSSTALPAQSAQQAQTSSFRTSLNLPQQDFVLFDSPAKRQLQQQHQHNSALLQQSASNNSIVPSPQAPHQSPAHLAASASPYQNQRVARIVQQSATGSCVPSSPAFPNRFASPASHSHFYASSAPSSTVALNNQIPVRPPVPPFPHSSGSIPRLPANMVLEDLQGLRDFSPAGFDGAAFSSPAMAASYDLNASVSSGSSNMGTVSPNDLLLQDPFMSTPNSSALTALTSPSDYNDSPHNDSYDVSPNFGSTDFDAVGNEAWFPLFAQDHSAVTVGVAGEAHASAGNPARETTAAADAIPSHGKSGHSRSPSTSTKHSSSAGVNSRRRDKPLPPIVIDDINDTVAMKRARNTLAARKSRERKAMRLDELEEKIAKLEAERDHWKDMALGRKG